MSDDRTLRAKALLPEGKFAEAGALFHAHWDDTGDAGSASRYLYCLRKAGHAAAAVTVGRRALGRHPQDLWVRRELIWALYEARVKHAEARGDLAALEHEAGEVLALDPEDLPRRLTVSAVVRLAKKRGRWQTVAEWCDRLDPARLEDTARPTTAGADGQHTPSPRAAWYFARVKAAVELQRWPEALALAERAAQLYPAEVNFPRWAALALAGQGQAEEAARRLEALARRQPSAWYLFQDLCELSLHQGKPDHALRWGCRAALAQGEERLKVAVYRLLACAGLALGKWTCASRHVVLSRALRRREGWPVSDDLQQLEARIRHVLGEAGEEWPVESEDVPTLLQLCRAEWQVEQYAGLPRAVGVLATLPDEQGRAWIQGEDGERISVRAADLPADVCRTGLPLEFVREPTSDGPQGEGSVRAVAVRLSFGVEGGEVRPATLGVATEF
jgi:tetratricopeptide (TPR) repeat protein